MLEPRHAVVLAALVAAAACSSGPESSPSGARDLTLVASPAQDAVLGPAERIAPAEAPRAPAVVAAPASRPKIARRAAVAAAPDPAPVVEAPVPEAAAEPAPPTPQPVVDAWTGAGRSLEPGQAVGVVPVAMGSGTRMPQTDLVSERGIRWTGMVHGDDRCIPGRDEMLPGFRARRN
jgi:hypothetical protein